METELKVTLKKHDTGNNISITEDTPEELFLSIFKEVLKLSGVSTTCLAGETPKIARYYYEDSGAYGVVLGGHDLGLALSVNNSAKLFAGFILADLAGKMK